MGKKKAAANGAVMRTSVVGKKRNEIFQMAMLEPKLSILDETIERETGADPDADIRLAVDFLKNQIHNLK